MAHSKAAPTLMLKHFKTENLAKIENTTSFSVTSSKITQKSDDADVNRGNDALRALLNFFVVRNQVCPADREPLILLTAVFNTWFDYVIK